MARSSENRGLWLFFAVALPMVWLTVVRLLTFGGAENSMDAFYHVALADFGWDYFSARTMPHVSLSVWATGFSDKELLFHLILSAVRGTGELLGIPAFPFHWPALFFCLLIIVAFVFAAWRFRVRHIWFFSLLLVLVSPQFIARILMLRPHDLAIALMLLSCVSFAGLRRGIDYWQPVLLGMIFAWSYSNPHFILLPALAFVVPLCRRSFTAAALLPLCCIGGIILGYIIHPQFPYTFINWKIQCIDVIRYVIEGRKDIFVGDELLSGGAWNYFSSPGLMLIAVFNLIGIYLMVRHYGWRRVPRMVQGMTAASCIVFAGIGFSTRVLEYACPLNLLLAGMLCTYWHRRATPFPISLGKASQQKLVAVLAVWIIIFSAFDCFYKFSTLKPAKFLPLKDYAVWVEKVKLPAGAPVANVIWSDFPVLLYSAPRQHYLWGMEPMFGYAADAERAVTIERFRTGRLRLTPVQLRQLAGTPLVFVSTRGWQLARDMAGMGCRIIYQGPDGWLFNLAEPVTGKAPARKNTGAR